MSWLFIVTKSYCGSCIQPRSVTKPTCLALHCHNYILSNTMSYTQFLSQSAGSGEQRTLSTQGGRVVTSLQRLHIALHYSNEKKKNFLNCPPFVPLLSHCLSYYKPKKSPWQTSLQENTLQFHR